MLVSHFQKHRRSEVFSSVLLISCLQPEQIYHHADDYEVGFFSLVITSVS